MFFNVDKIIVLGLLKNKAEIEKKFSSMFTDHTKKLEYHLVPGVGSTQNDGNYHSSLWSILHHRTIDNISKDIFKNHVNIYKNARRNNWNRILVLEDDVVFPKIYPKQNKVVNRWLTENKSYDILYLGYCNWPWIWSTFRNSYIVKPAYPLTLHSYIINRKGMDKVLNLIQSNPKLEDLHIDKLLAQEKSLHKFAVFPMIGFQAKDPSLYSKACDKLGIYVNFTTFCRINEYVSLIIPIFLFCLFFFYFFFRISKDKWIKSFVF